MVIKASIFKAKILEKMIKTFNLINLGHKEKQLNKNKDKNKEKKKKKKIN